MFKFISLILQINQFKIFFHFINIYKFYYNLNHNIFLHYLIIYMSNLQISYVNIHINIQNYHPFEYFYKYQNKVINYFSKML